MLRALFFIVVIFLVAWIAVGALWPERLAVNVPLWGTLLGAEAPELSELERRMTLPEGFRIGIFADGIKDARFLHFAPNGDLLVSSRREGAIFLVEPDRDGDGRSDAVRRLVTDLSSPHGLDLHEGNLYIGETDKISRVAFDAASGTVSGSPETVVPDLPSSGNHYTKTVRIGPDGYMYVSIGSTCNVCVEDDRRRAAMMRYSLDGSNEELYASGLRNSVGFDWQPETGDLYATDNGRDLLGDDFPPCELNKVEQGKFYGWPFVNGNGVPDPDEGAGRAEEIAASVSPVHGFVAHTAPLGMTFYRGDAFPARYKHAAFVAQHGSWNRTTKSGYRLVALHWDGDEIKEADFATGWELDEDVIARPVDVAEGPDGALYVSDDYGGVIYRIWYAGI